MLISKLQKYTRIMKRLRAEYTAAQCTGKCLRAKQLMQASIKLNKAVHKLIEKGRN